MNDDAKQFAAARAALRRRVNADKRAYLQRYEGQPGGDLKATTRRGLEAALFLTLCEVGDLLSRVEPGDWRGLVVAQQRYIEATEAMTKAQRAAAATFKGARWQEAVVVEWAAMGSTFGSLKDFAEACAGKRIDTDDGAVKLPGCDAIYRFLLHARSIGALKNHK